MIVRWIIIGLSLLSAAFDLVPFLIGHVGWVASAVVVVILTCIYRYIRAGDKRVELARVSLRVVISAFAVGFLARLLFVVLMYGFPAHLTWRLGFIYGLWFLPAVFGATGVYLLLKADHQVRHRIAPFLWSSAIMWGASLALDAYWLTQERF